MTIAQIAGNLADRALANLGQRREITRGSGVALRSQRDVRGSLGKVQSAFRIADDLGRLERGLRHQKSLRIGVAHVLGRADENAACDEFRILAAIDHAGKPVQGRIGIAAAHRLDERRDDVIVHVLVLVVWQTAMRIGCFDDLGTDQSRGILGAGRNHVGGKLKRRQSRARVAAGHYDQRVKGVRRKLVLPRQAALVDNRTGNKLGDVVIGKTPQLDDARTRDQGGIHFEIRVLGSSADKDNRAVLDGMKKRVLLRAIEAMDLIDEQDGSPALQQARLCSSDLTTQVGNGSANGRYLDKRGGGALGDDVRDGRLAGSRRPEQDDRA